MLNGSALLSAASASIATPDYDYLIALPEIIMLSAICLILVVDLFVPPERKFFTYFLSQATLIGLAVFTVLNMADKADVGFSGSFVRDPMGDLLKVVIYLVCALVFLYSKDYLKARKLFKGEYFVLGLFGVLGMMILVSAYSFLTLYLGLEVMSLALYTMVAYNRNSGTASEAAMKYFVLGAIASGMLLYGISIVYGITGEIGIQQVGEYIGQKLNSPKDIAANVSLVFGLVFLLIGIAFKLGVVPFHMWVPDVYHGAPTSVTLYLGSVTKLAAFAMVMRILHDGTADAGVAWSQILIVLSILSLAIGNIVAIAQTNIKRMLAYSTISHMGFLLLGIIAANETGYEAAMFYVVTYAIIAAAAFGLIILLSRAGFEADRIDDFKGLNAKHPWFALMVLIIMFSLAGVPPTVGFFAKLEVLKAVVSVDLVWLAVVAVVFAIIGAFYYIRIIKIMYFDKPEADAPAGLAMGADMKFALSVNCLLALGLGLFPNELMQLVARVI